jgi:hypothetical protein
MKALFIQHDHVSPLGPVGERFRQHGYEIETLLVVPENKYREPNVEFSFPDYNNYDVIIPLGSPGAPGMMPALATGSCLNLNGYAVPSKPISQFLEFASAVS